MKAQLGRLEKVELRDYWKDEAKDFTPWLAEEDNINLLGETVGMELEVQEQEAKVGTFSADILCKDINTDRCVVIENQLEKTDHDHLGKVITYCSGLDAYTAIWIARTFDEEHRAAIDWLNSITDDNYNFFGIEVRLFKIGDSALAPQFDIVAKPNNWSKTIKKQVSGNTETEKLRLDFWNAYFDFVDKKGLDGITHARATTDHWSDFRVGIAGFHYAHILTVKNWIGGQVYLGGDNAAQNMIDPPELASILNSHYLLNILHHTNQRMIAGWIGTDGTNLLITQIMAHLTIFHLSTQGQEGCRETLGIAWIST